MAPDNPGETVATLGGMDALCAGADEWAAEQAGRSVSAVLAGLYDPSEMLQPTFPRVYDAVTHNAIQCSSGGEGCPMRVGEGASNTAVGERTAIMVVAEDTTVVPWRMTCYVEVEVRVARLELVWMGMPERLQMDSLATKSELSSFRIVNPGQPGIDDPLVVAGVDVSYEDTVGAPACPRADAECSSVPGWLAVTGTRDFAGTPVVLPALVHPGAEIIVTLRSSGIAAGFRDAEFWGRVSVVTGGGVVAGELAVKMQVAEEALRIIAMPSVLPSATLAAGSSGTASVTFYNVDRMPLVWEVLESEYRGPTGWVTQQLPAADDPTQAAPVRCHETGSPTLNGYHQEQRPLVSYQSCGARCGGTTRYAIEESCVPDYFDCAGHADDSIAYPDCNAAYLAAGATSPNDCPFGCTYMGTDNTLCNSCALADLATNAIFNCHTAGLGSDAGGCVYVGPQNPITRDCEPMQPNPENSSDCDQPLSNWRRLCTSPSLNPNIDTNDKADVLAHGDSYLDVGESISMTLTYAAPTFTGTFAGTHTLLGSRITDDQTNGDMSTWSIETTIVVVSQERIRSTPI